MAGKQRHWSSVDPDEVVDVDLTALERTMLWQGLHQWGGPTRPNDAVAAAIGFADVEELHCEGARIRLALRAEEALPRRDWARALVALAYVFSDNLYGAAGDWEIVSGYSDRETLQTLRGLQDKFAGLRAEPRRRP